MATYTDYPIFQVSGSVKPNILIMLDNSKSTNFAAYGTWNGAGQTISEPYEGGPAVKPLRLRYASPLMMLRRQYLTAQWI